ncbi:hypothetical protein ACQU0X_25935 [Pseudovibrio ascidiaceicola]|uniref:hypothetical protein n=1 Tax=Pseudovibrio ascidiaceicola TaxID=285279 RepID=UPI003D35C84A
MKRLIEDLNDAARRINAGEFIDTGETSLLLMSAANALNRVPCPSGCNPPENVTCQICADSGTISVVDQLILADATQRHG